MGLEGDPELEQTEASMIGWIWSEISSSYLNIGLTCAIVYLLYKILFQKDEEPVFNPEPPMPPMKKQVSFERILNGLNLKFYLPQDMTLQQLRQYDGVSEASAGRICVAVNGKIFDVTKGKRFYGPGMSYCFYFLCMLEKYLLKVVHILDLPVEMLLVVWPLSVLIQLVMTMMTCPISSQVRWNKFKSGNFSSVRSMIWWESF